MDIKETVQSELTNLVDSGKVQEIIREQLEKTIKSTFSDLLRDCSDFGKNLKDKLSQAMDIDLTKLTLLNYNTIVTDIVKAELDKSILQHVQIPITEAIRQIASPLEKKEWLLSEIIEKFIEEEVEKDAYDGSITLIVDDGRYGTTHVSFDKEEDKKEYNCEYRLSIRNETGTLWSFNIGSYKTVSQDQRQGPIHGSFDNFIFKLYASGCTIKLDETSNYWSND